MFLSDSQISMRSLCLNLLFTLVDYKFVICLTKCLSRLVGVKSKSFSGNFNGIIIPLLSLCSEGTI